MSRSPPLLGVESQKSYPWEVISKRHKLSENQQVNQIIPSKQCFCRPCSYWCSGGTDRITRFRIKYNTDLYDLNRFLSVRTAYQWRIQDFPFGGGADLQRGCFFVKCMRKQKNWVPQSVVLEPVYNQFGATDAPILDFGHLTASRVEPLTLQSEVRHSTD